MGGWTEDDAVMADLRQWLVDRGFVVLSDHYSPDVFGNQVVTLSRPVGVRLVKDRGDWAVEVCGQNGEWRRVGDWSDELGHGKPRTTSAEEDAKHLRALLDQIERLTGAPGSRDIHRR